MMNTANTIEQLKVTWRCPSNIAIVKYWGKHGKQLPCNPSVSLTLNNSYTEVDLSVSPKTGNEDVELSYFFEGERNDAFGKRVAKYLADNIEHFSFLKDHAVEIQSSNSFPHSAGIASSASAFGAIALAMFDVEYQFKGQDIDDAFYQKASNLARLGSGSASRSLFPQFAAWGEINGLEGSSDLYATPVKNVHPIFHNMCDSILIVDDQPKAVSSSVGHGLMKDHPYADARFIQAKKRCSELLEVLESGDMDKFITICESEALTLHAMMMTSKDYYLLVKPNTIEVIDKIFKYREKTGVPVYFTLDAGPNIHVLYPKKYQSDVEDFIKNDLQESCISTIFDHEGQGPMKMNK